MSRSIALLVGGLALLFTARASAQEFALGQEYGSGVQAYFGGDAVKAYERLTSTINRGSKDPRAFYFRGLAYLKLGRPEEAAADFRKGAELESKDVNRVYNVGKSLERVQGSERQELENYRVDARMAALEQLERERKERYEANQREEQRVVREQAVLAPEKPIDPAEATRSAEGSTDPFAVPESAAKGKAAGDDPFANPPDKAAGKASGKKAADKPVAPKKPAAAKKAAGDSDPFSGEKKPAAKKGSDDSDPFKGGGEAKKPTEKKPPAKAAPKKKPDEEDPFGS
jgi:hypothetical protein